MELNICKPSNSAISVNTIIFFIFSLALKSMMLNLKIQNLNNKSLSHLLVCKLLLLCLLKTGSVVVVVVVAAISGQISAGTRANVSIARPPCTRSQTW